MGADEYIKTYSRPASMRRTLALVSLSLLATTDPAVPPIRVTSPNVKEAGPQEMVDEHDVPPTTMKSYVLLRIEDGSARSFASTTAELSSRREPRSEVREGDIETIARRCNRTRSVNGRRRRLGCSGGCCSFLYVVVLSYRKPIVTEQDRVASSNTRDTTTELWTRSFSLA